MNYKINYTVLHVLVVSIPASLIFYYALNAGMLADNDYWGFIRHILAKEGGFSLNFGDWFYRENEHFLIFPKIIYGLNILITSGNNVALSLFAWFMALLQVILLYRLIPYKLNNHPILFTAILFVIAVYIFSPTPAHNWFLGMSGVAWISANFFVLSAIFSINRYANTDDNKFIALTVLYSLCAMATYSTSLSIFPTLIIASLLLGLKRKDQFFFILFCVIILGLYFATYQTPKAHPSLSQSATTLVTYFFAFLGSLLTRDIDVAILSGIFGLLSTLVMLFFIFKKQIYWKAILPWGLIQIYACGNAAMAAIARSGFGTGQVFASRYGSLPSLFWLCWIVIASTLCYQLQQRYRHYAFITLFIVSSVLIINTYRVGFQIAKPLFKRAEYKQLTLAAIYSYAFDIDLIDASILPRGFIRTLKPLTNILKANQHIPFNGIFKDCPKIGSQITRIHAPVNVQYYGHVDIIKLGKNSVTELQGWSNNNNQSPVCIAFTNHDNIVKAIASYGFSRTDIPKAFPEISSMNTGWRGFGKFVYTDKMIKVFMLSSYDKYWVPLKGYYRLNQHPPYSEKIEALPEY